jgi:hypothetical protein
MPAKKKDAVAPVETPRDQRIARGSRAKQILDDPLMQDAFDALEASYESTWRNSSEAEAAKREQIYLSLKALEGVKLELESAVTGGKLAKNQ